jgi:predicted nucleic acid-binding protein
MNDKVFIDTNILIYTISNDAVKREQAQNLLIRSNEFVISTQVINEFAHTCIRKNYLTEEQTQRVVQGYFAFFTLVLLDQQTIDKAFDVKKRYGFAYYDSLIVASALQNNCKIVYSEDMQNGMRVDNQLIITNPFLP